MVTNSAIKILAIDDDLFVLKRLSQMLSNLSFTDVATCDSGYRALGIVDQPDTSPDLILLDLNMPEMDGVEFVRHLVEHHYNGSLILVSSENERMLHSAEMLVKAHQITLLGHMNKPGTPEELSKLIEKWAPPFHVPLSIGKKTYTPDELRSALTNGELFNVYQPVVAVATRQLVGVESLVRWRHPLDGTVYPDQFISLAESSGLIDALTRITLAESLAQAKIWRESGLALRMAVNLSMDSLRSLEFADLVAGLATAAGVAPGELVLEVTESRLWQDLRVPLEVLTRLRMKRFHLSIDDFGTGHSSLTQLRTIPFDELKIDQSFVHRAWADRTARVMYEASFGLAKQLNMVVVAEGVEDQDDWNFLCETGCHLAQGYFIARPMLATDLPAWMEQWYRLSSQDYLVESERKATP